MNKFKKIEEFIEEEIIKSTEEDLIKIINKTYTKLQLKELRKKKEDRIQKNIISKKAQQLLDSWCKKNGQKYQDQWNYTAAFTGNNKEDGGLTGKGNFLEILKASKEFIDKNKDKEFDYKKYQEKIKSVYPKGSTSIRKAINQLVKLGFIEHKCSGYHPLLSDFLDSVDREDRNDILSQIVFDNSSFSKNMTENNGKNELGKNKNEVKFFYNTLKKLKKLTKNDIIAMMQIMDVTKYEKKTIKRNEINKLLKNVESQTYIISKKNKFSHLGTWTGKKYNQIGYVDCLLKHMGRRIHEKDGIFYAKKLSIPCTEKKKNNRTRIGQVDTIMKKCLKIESNNKCMVTNKQHCINSHIYRYEWCVDKKTNHVREQAYDPDNGLYISKDLDIRFNNGEITFNHESGEIIFSEGYDLYEMETMMDHKIEEKYLNSRRREFLKLHKKYVFEKGKRPNKPKSTPKFPKKITEKCKHCDSLHIKK